MSRWFSTLLPLAIALVLSTSSWAQTPAKTTGPGDCAETFDAVGDACTSPQMTPLAAPGEPLSTREDLGKGAPDAFEDPHAMGWRLVGAAGVASVVGVGLMAASAAYFQQIANPRSPSGHGVNELPGLIQGQVVFSQLAVGAWIATAVLGGSGLVFFTFDPRSGKLRFDDPEAD